MPSADPVDREVPELAELVPTDMKKSYDMKRVIKAVVDKGSFFEVAGDYAKNMIVGFARMGGKVVGIVANQPMLYAGCIDINASDKSSRFIRTCDAFNIPLITLVDVPGFLPGTNQEYGGIIRHGAKMLYSWSEATVPKISCIIRKMYGGSIPAMGVHQIGFDQVFAWPTAEMQMVGAEASVRVLFGKEMKVAKDQKSLFPGKGSGVPGNVPDALSLCVTVGYRRGDPSERHPEEDYQCPDHSGVQEGIRPVLEKARQHSAVRQRVERRHSAPRSV